MAPLFQAYLPLRSNQWWYYIRRCAESNVQGAAEVDGHYPAHEASHAEQHSDPIKSFHAIHSWGSLNLIHQSDPLEEQL